MSTVNLKNLDPLQSFLLPSDDGGERVALDEMLVRFAGEFGPWQQSQFVLTSIAWALNALHTMVVIFSDHEPAWRCVEAGNYGGFPCRNTTSMCDLQPGSWEWIGGASTSTVAEWGLVCGDKYKVGLAQSSFFLGSMAGAGIFGHLSDSFLGRKGTLTAVCTMNAIFGCLTALSPAYWVYAALRFLTGFSTGGVGLCSFALATEPVGPSKRGVVGMSTFYFFSFGCFFLSATAYYLQSSWRTLYIITSLPSFVFLVSILPFISESPRWYLVRQKTSKAMEVVRAIAKSDGKHLPDGIQLVLDCCHKKQEKGSDCQYEEAINVPSNSSIVNAIRLPVIRKRLVLVVMINFFCSIVYYGISLNVGNLKTSIYVSVVVNAAAEMPAYALSAVLLRCFGRKPLLVGTMWFSGVFCLIGSLVVVVYNAGGVWKVVRLGCGVMGIFAMAATFNLMFVYTVELFPTVVRNAALGCVTQAGQLGAILAPLVVVVGGGVPFTVFAVCGVLGGILALLLPETLDQPLYDTLDGMKDGENDEQGKLLIGNSLLYT